MQICTVNSGGPQEEIIDVIPLKGRTRGKDIWEAVLDCLKIKKVKTIQRVSVALDWALSMRGPHWGFVSLLQRPLDRKLMIISLQPKSRGTVCSNISSGVQRDYETCHSNSEQNNVTKIQSPTVPFIVV